jgi:hypothetical protein
MAPTQQQIYARRRGLALLALLLAVIVGWALFQGPSAEAPPSGIGMEQTEEPTANPEVTDCQPNVITVQAKIGDEAGPKSTFQADQKPMIWYEITNSGMVDCNFNLGSRVTFFTISSGNEVYWSSRECDRSADVDAVMTLAANSTKVSPKGVWERVRSSSEGCGAEQRKVPAGGASYLLKVEVNGVFSDNRVQFLLY